jgi:hypothetical protein
MMFSSSMSVVEYFLLNRFPVPYGAVSFLLWSSQVYLGTYYVFSEIWAALFFTTLAFFAAIVGQRVARKLIGLLGRASLIIFILSFTIFISALSLGTGFPPLGQPSAHMVSNPTQKALKSAGGVGISNAIHKIVQHEYMGFDNICKYDA